MIYDYCVIGGGIVGLATAKRLIEIRPGAAILVIEKEDTLAYHQTGHNSGVIHAGIYYTPGSLKATLCRAGLTAALGFCEQHGIKVERCGKLIVATNKTEDDRIQKLYERATANGLILQKVSGDELRAIEPRITGTSALLSKETSIVDWQQVALKYAELFQDAGGEILVGRQIERITEYPNRVDIGSDSETWQAKKVIVCGGLQADRLARLAGIDIDFRIIPFRGEYFQLPPTMNGIVNHLIYPAPDPELPFLGIHLTRMIDGSVTVGPNAVLSFARERYAKYALNFKDTFASLTYPGFWKLIWQHRKNAIHEFKGSMLKRAYLKECRKYCPELELSDLLPYRAGIRAQVVTNNGELVHDFLFGETERTLHVFNAPSPAATSSLPIGEMIAEKCV